MVLTFSYPSGVLSGLPAVGQYDAFDSWLLFGHCHHCPLSLSHSTCIGRIRGSCSSSPFSVCHFLDDILQWLFTPRSKVIFSHVANSPSSEIYA